MEKPEAEIPAWQEKKKAQLRIAPVTHGGYRFIESGLWPICKKCILAQECPEYEPESTTCALFNGIQNEQIRQMMQEPHIRPAHAPLVILLAKELTFIALADVWVSRIGVFRVQDGLDVQPILTRRAASIHTTLKLTDRLGMNPMAQKLLNFDPDRAPKDAKEIISYLELKKRIRETARRSPPHGDGTDEAP